MVFHRWKMRAYIEKVGKRNMPQPNECDKSKKKKRKEKRENHQAFESFV